ncbi:hypothetical protein BRADI_1g00405v3 [Brachypodium distachyon]|uniref:Bifunctional inhibitor/plant lipid transfer protein/seed storage helical domain-containing protein n=1 Tax=Brachypodium distachyon TaxID=15368 RepID=A0A0Q3N5B4_BRADI|nr:hypothetical protein BRADI_1g00405v3 [Brachypodium distachyon]
MAKLLVVAVSANSCEQDTEDRRHDRECQRFHTWPAEPKLVPSEACCAVWQRVDLPCLCKQVDEAKMKVLCMDKAVWVAKYSKRP